MIASRTLDDCKRLHLPRNLPAHGLRRTPLSHRELAEVRSSAMRVSLRPYQYIVPIGDEHQHEPFGVIPAKLVRDAGRCIRVPTKDTAPISVRCRLRAVPMRVLNDLQAVLRRNEHPREVVVSGGMIHTAERCAGVWTIDAARFIRGGHELPTLLIRLLRDRTVCAQTRTRRRARSGPPDATWKTLSSLLFGCEYLTPEIDGFGYADVTHHPSVERGLLLPSAASRPRLRSY